MRMRVLGDAVAPRDSQEWRSGATPMTDCKRVILESSEFVSPANEVDRENSTRRIETYSSSDVNYRLARKFFDTT